ncbi:hypothetical protein QA089_000119 [Meyerozyma guilliermondii]
MSSIHSSVYHDHNKHIMQPPKFTSRAIAKYFKTRFTTLVPSKEELKGVTKTDVFFPFKVLGELNRRQWNFYLIGLAGWTWDAFDFFAVSLNVANIAESLNESHKSITWGITLVLMLRAVGAVIFGLWGDRYGRKWPYIVNMFLLVVLQIGTGFVQTYKQFLGVRALFGIAMGGMFGNCAACALDDCPPKARGFISGMFQQGYALGYLLVVVFQRAITDTTEKGWRSLFWFSAGPAVLFMIWRFFTPETDTFLRQQDRRRASREKEPLKIYQFSSEGKEAMRKYWLVVIYSVLMMAGFNFMSHGSQDLYPTMLTVQYGYGADRSAVTNSVANLGAIFGGMVFGHISTFIGRRLAIIIACILGGAMIYPWAFIKGSGINAGVFFLQAGVQGAWGVIPIHLSELSPPEYRSFVAGTAYQLGNLCSSASSTIEATIGQKFPLRGEEGDVYDYAKVMAIFIACVFVYVILITFFGPENRGAAMGVERDEYLVEDTDDEKSIEDSLDDRDSKSHSKHHEVAV